MLEYLIKVGCWASAWVSFVVFIFRLFLFPTTIEVQILMQSIRHHLHIFCCKTERLFYSFKTRHWHCLSKVTTLVGLSIHLFSSLNFSCVLDFYSNNWRGEQGVKRVLYAETELLTRTIITCGHLPRINNSHRERLNFDSEKHER